MDYNNAVSYIHSLKPFGMHPGLERINELCDALGNPQLGMKFVHVAGTNGKGSVSTMIAGALLAEGKRVGLFTSPYVTDFRERIRINGEMVEKEAFAAAVTEIEPLVSALAEREMQPTEFEVITAAAFTLFKRAECEYVVLEVGLGGRLDSTNVIASPQVSVITSVSIDHTAVLGNTVEEIAAEKCGIIKQGCKTVSYPSQLASVEEIIRETCRRKDNSFAKPNLDLLSEVVNDIYGVRFKYKNVSYSLSMSGEYQALNALTAIEACNAIGLSGEAIKTGVEQARVAARMEVISRNPLILLDGGHNDDGGRVVAQSLKGLLGGKRIIAVMGMMADKNVDAYLSYVAPLCAEIIATSVSDNPRTMSATDLCALAKNYCAECSAVENANEAVDLAKQKIGGFDCLLVCGSLYLAGEVRENLLSLT